MIRVIGLLVLASILYFAFKRQRARRFGLSSEAWPSTLGTIILSKPWEGPGIPRSGMLSYTYLVGNKKYKGSMITLHDDGILLNQFTHAHNIGEKVSVYYDPSQPSRAVLIQGQADFGYGKVETGLFYLSQAVILAFGGAFCYWTWMSDY